MNDQHLINKSTTWLTVLRLTFLTSLCSTLLSMLLTFFFKTTILFYPFAYLLIILIVTFSCLLKFHSEWRVYKSLLFLILFFLCITIPITSVTGNIITAFVFFKNTLLFILLFLYFKLNFKNISQLLPFLKTVVLGGIFFSIYICFEFFNKLFNVFPVFTKLIADYIIATENEQFLFFADPDKFDVSSVIRPLGLEINFNSGGFFLASIFFILIISGKRFIKSKFLRKIFIAIVYLSVFITTSRQNIFCLHGLLIIMILILLTKKRKFEWKKFRYIRNNVGFVFAMISIGILVLVSLNATVYSDFLSGKSGGTTEILLDDFRTLPDIFFTFLMDYPFNFFFGIGSYTPTYPGMYNDLPIINELHFLLDIFYPMGLVGFCIFWSVFLGSLVRCWRGFKRSKVSQDGFQDLFLSVMFIDLLFIGNIIHYSPIGMSTSFIIAMIPLFAMYAKNPGNVELVKNK